MLISCIGRTNTIRVFPAVVAVVVVPGGTAVYKIVVFESLLVAFASG